MAMTTNAKNTIKLKQYVNIQMEKVANAAITPGMLIELMSTNKVRKHATAGANVLVPMFALEDELQGKSIDDAYAAADQVNIGIFRTGDYVYAILTDGQSVSIGDPLESAGDGMLQKHTADIESPGTLSVYPKQIVAMAAEAVDTSDSSGGESSGTLDFAKRIKVMVL
jgi:hypothetical protein